MIIHKPTTPFAKITKPETASREDILKLSDDQVRYALWATCILLFGIDESNAPLIVLTTPLSDYLRFQEAQLILAQLGCSSLAAPRLEHMKQQVEENLRNE